MSTDNEREQVERELSAEFRQKFGYESDEVTLDMMGGSAWAKALVDTRLKLRAAEKALEHISQVNEWNSSDSGLVCDARSVREMAEEALAEIRRKP